MDGQGISVLLAFVIVVVFFLIGRELVCWYWKINRQVELLEKILIELKNQNGKTGQS